MGTYCIIRRRMIISLPANVGKFINSVVEQPECTVGLSALLTTTMVNMESVVSEIRKVEAETRILIGGAPVSDDFCKKIDTDNYLADPQGTVNYLNSLVAY